MGKTVIFGGTFNPIHLAHVEMIEYICSLPQTERLLLIPTAVPPHKVTFLAPAEHRLAMCKLAVNGMDKVQVLDIEITAGGKSYTLNTLKMLKERFPTADFALLIGGDMLSSFHEWRQYKEILLSVELWVFKRKGLDLVQFNAAVKRLTNDGGRITVLPFVPKELSSSCVRKTVANNGNIGGMVQKKIAEYILKNNLYCGQKMMNYEVYKVMLKERLTEKRYYHSLQVADEAVRLAKKYSANQNKAYLAGLMHDVMKDTDGKEQLKLLSQFGIILSNVEKNAKKLWHAMAGALYVEKVLKIDDSEIIDAIRYHTTAKAGMSLLAKVLYLADFTSSDRDYDGVEEMREAVDKDLETAMDIALTFTINDLKERGKEIHPDTLAAYREIVKKPIS